MRLAYAYPELTMIYGSCPGVTLVNTGPMMEAIGRHATYLT